MEAHDLQLVLERRVVEPEVQAAALERLGQLARVVRGQQHDRAACAPRCGPARGSRSGSRTGPRAASPRTPGRSCRSRRSAARPARSEAIAVISGRSSRNSSPKMSSWTSSQPVPVGLGLDAQQLLAVVPLVQRLGLVEALVALQAHERRGRGSATSALASSVLPTPAGPSTSTGLPSLAARKETSAVDALGQVADRAQALLDGGDGLGSGGGSGGHGVDDRGAWPRPSPRRHHRRPPSCCSWPRGRRRHRRPPLRLAGRRGHRIAILFLATVAMVIGGFVAFQGDEIDPRDQKDPRDSGF